MINKPKTDHFGIDWNVF